MTNNIPAARAACLKSVRPNNHVGFVSNSHPEGADAAAADGWIGMVESRQPSGLSTELSALIVLRFSIY